MLPENPGPDPEPYQKQMRAMRKPPWSLIFLSPWDQWKVFDVTAPCGAYLAP